MAPSFAATVTQIPGRAPSAYQAASPGLCRGSGSPPVDATNSPRSTSQRRATPRRSRSWASETSEADLPSLGGAKVIATTGPRWPWKMRGAGGNAFVSKT
jgi:hypothetical protein